ncbi:sperm associated antigen 8 [Takifugu flavidus]|uniref:sperm associated antigen 8 n=1 Tax=Takifugu flavidus TaxID=433684 RepID=UPI0025448F7B|nr:sperm associated antigen 8 [Takifugu flavidus]
MNRQSATVQMKTRNPVCDSERREKTNVHIMRHGHVDLIIDPGSKMEARTSYMAAYSPPKSPEVRLCGTRRERMVRCIAQELSEKIQHVQKEPVSKTEFCSTTQRDFSVPGFVQKVPELTVNRDYETDQAITFWSENSKWIQGVTAIQNPREPFKKSSMFSTPISQRLDEIDPQYNNLD